MKFFGYSIAGTGDQSIITKAVTLGLIVASYSLPK